MATFLQYIDEAMRQAQYEPLEDDEGFYGHIPGFEGLWATGKTVEEARADLYKSLDGWLTVNYFISQMPLPEIGVTLGVEPAE